MGLGEAAGVFQPITERPVEADMREPDQRNRLWGLGLYAHYHYLDRYGTAVMGADLVHHRLIGFDREWPVGILGRQGLTLSAADFRVRTDSDLAQLAAVRTGCGIGVVQDGIAVGDPELAPVLREAVAFKLPMWVVMHEDLRAAARVRAAFDMLSEALAGYVGLS